MLRNQGITWHPRLMPIFRREGKMPPEERRFEKKDLAGWGVLTQMRQATVCLGLAFEKLTRRTRKDAAVRWCQPHLLSDRRFSGTLAVEHRPFEDVLVVLKRVISITSLESRAFTRRAPHLRTMAKTWGSVSAKNGGYPHKSTSTVEDVKMCALPQG